MNKVLPAAMRGGTEQAREIVADYEQ